MPLTAPAATDPHPRRRIALAGTEISYVETGAEGPVEIVFLHGNPTSSYLWRNVLPHVAEAGRCYAPDLMGMGDSGPAPNASYRFVDHAATLDEWFDALGLAAVVVVGHDWGGALGFHWARRHRDRVAAVVYMETIVKPLGWDDWPENARKAFAGFRSPAGEEMILEKNMFVERVLPASVMRTLGPEEMRRYRKPFERPGEGRRPTLTWPREIPIAGEPADVHEIVETYGTWLDEDARLPKLFVNADPGSILVGAQRDFCRRWPNQTEVTVPGRHFVQEDAPAEIGRAIARFVGALG
ncbi:MAG: haloalkane dehalogenase [Alphaproteobacteria bacterium]|nr:haloalkane dehalogenase [Alphaproteobacteria bacterium]